MKVYLFLDRPDPIQNPLGSRIESLTDGRLQVGTLYERKAQILLGQTSPPVRSVGSCLVTVKRGRVHAAAGRRLAWRLIWLLGPIRAWRVWKLTHPSGRPRDVGTCQAISPASTADLAGRLRV